MQLGSTTSEGEEDAAPEDAAPEGEEDAAPAGGLFFSSKIPPPCTHLQHACIQGILNALFEGFLNAL